ncbi:MAG: exo-alpha-sialidase [Methanobacteriota archaeon]|nr:MAG: exo-alpha-sialidase [Euryarchaeota archaeon]
MRYVVGIVVLVLGFVLIAAGAPASAASKGNSQTFDITTLAGKVASIQATDGFYLRVSPFLEQEADAADAAPAPGPSSPITPTFILSSPLDGTSVAAPAVTVNQDTLGAPQNEPAIAVDPNNADRIVVGSNDYITRTWTCTIDGTPCSALGDAYSGTYYSNDGGATWCCVATDPSHLGTLIPGVERLTGGIYDAGGDPSLAFDSQGHVFFAGLGFDRTAAPNTVAVNKGTFDSEGALTWGPPTFINPTNSPSTLNDKEWIGADTHAGSPFQDRVYVSWTRFLFNPHNGRYVQSPIAFVFSSDGGATFSDPQLIVSNVLYDQGSRVVVGPDGTVYVFWEGSTRFASFNSIWMVASSDGGVSWSKPVAVAPAVDIIPPFNTVFRVNSFPAADIAPDGTLYVAWSSEVNNDATTYGADPVCAYFISGVSSVYNNCHSSAVWSKSTDGGATWSSPVPILTTLDGSNRAAIGYPVTQPDGKTKLFAPPDRRVDSFWPAIGVTPSGNVYMSAYAADVVSPWQLCKSPATPTAVGRINCLELGNYTHNARLDYVVADLTTGVTNTVTTHPINSRYGFGGGFIGDYTSLAVGSDNVFHAVWTDTNNKQSVDWWFGFEFASGTATHQQDIVTASGDF